MIKNVFFLLSSICIIQISASAQIVNIRDAGKQEQSAKVINLSAQNADIKLKAIPTPFIFLFRNNSTNKVSET